MKDKIMILLARLFGKKVVWGGTYENIKTTMTAYKLWGKLYITGIDQVTVEKPGESLIWSPGIAERMQGLNKVIKSKAIQNLGTTKK